MAENLYSGSPFLNRTPRFLLVLLICFFSFWTSLARILEDVTFFPETYHLISVLNKLNNDKNNA